MVLLSFSVVRSSKFNMCVLFVINGPHDLTQWWPNRVYTYFLVSFSLHYTVLRGILKADSNTVSVWESFVSWWRYQHLRKRNVSVRRHPQQSQSINRFLFYVSACQIPHIKSFICFWLTLMFSYLWFSFHCYYWVQCVFFFSPFKIYAARVYVMLYSILFFMLSNE